MIDQVIETNEEKLLFNFYRVTLLMSPGFLKMYSVQMYQYKRRTRETLSLYLQLIFVDKYSYVCMYVCKFYFLIILVIKQTILYST